MIGILEQAPIAGRDRRLSSPRTISAPNKSSREARNRQALPDAPWGIPLTISFMKDRARSPDSIFVRMLWAAFPSPSERKLAERASPALGVTERQIVNWLRGNNDGKAAHLAQLVVLVGVETFAQILEGRRQT